MEGAMTEMGERLLRVGWGSAYADDNLDPAEDLACNGDLQVLCFDALAERTLALAQVRKRENPQLGYDLRLDEFSQRFFPYAARGLKLITNMGAANPTQAAVKLAQAGKSYGLKIAAITGDDVLDTILETDPVLDEVNCPLSAMTGKVISANAYIGADGVANALSRGADVVVGGRLADPSLFLGAAMWWFGWSPSDWSRLGQGIVVGHLLECGVHVTGGNYADPPYRKVPGLDHLGMPWAEVFPDGEAVIGKLPDSGGMVTPNTVKAQLVYEIHDPARYLTPDVVADFCQVTVEATENRDQVRVRGGAGTMRPDTLKVLIGVDQGFTAESEVSFAGPGAYDRALLCQEVLQSRYQRFYKTSCEEVRFDLIGVNAIHGRATPTLEQPPYEVRVRMAVHTQQRAVAERVAREVEWQYFGPSGAGGMRSQIRPFLALYSSRIPRDQVPVEVSIWS
ncbi:MAG: ABC transporter substrate-binding protein [Sulfobacillus benefaciens]|uniref:ABC transporter substrate-binding protein n=1 Tax=Sulfobacillus benefaciens TaxID=453960 RepID=A0A2T2XJS0_9FIRM|nr:MAG: ABC transporter substrate-binding protein [Sulfobacillus benefaciens]